MVDHSHDTHDSTVRERTEIRETRTGGGSGLAFIVGGLVVAVGVIAWLLFGGMGEHMGGRMGHDGGGKSTSSVSVNVGGAGSGSGSGATKPAATSAQAGASSGGGAQAGATSSTGSN